MPCLRLLELCVCQHHHSLSHEQLMLMCYHIYTKSASLVTEIFCSSTWLWNGLVCPTIWTYQPSPHQFYLKAISFMDAVRDILAFLKKVYTVAKVWKYLHKINPKIKYWFGFERSGSTKKLTNATENIRQKLILYKRLLKCGIYKLIATHLLDHVSHNF